MAGFACLEPDRLFGIGRLRADIGFRYDSASLLSRRRVRSLNHCARQPRPFDGRGVVVRFSCSTHISITTT